jgi:hypothetical protein
MHWTRERRNHADTLADRGLRFNAAVMKNFFTPKISAWGVLNAAGALGCLCTFTGFLGAYGWILELTSHFRVQYAALLGVIAGLLSVRRKFTWPSVFAAAALINVGTVAPLYVGKPASVVATDAKLRALLLNVDTSKKWMVGGSMN